MHIGVNFKGKQTKKGENPGPMPLADFIARANKDISEKI